ncbi:MAG: class I SAM-dependent methyltransferase [Nocardioidaceae bacterium]
MDVCHAQFGSHALAGVRRPDGGGVMTNETFDRSSWERRWAHALRESPEKVASRPPNSHLLAEIGDLQPGFALDAGCGHGSEAIWLATAGWQVTAVDFSATALDFGRSTAHEAGTDVAERIEWVEGDLGSWSPPPGRFDLVSCLYVHVAGSVVEMVRRLGAGVAPGGTLLLVGHRPVDPATGAPTPAAGQVQVSVDEAVQALGSHEWHIVVAEERPRAAVGTGVDAVIRAVRRGEQGLPGRREKPER